MLSLAIRRRERDALVTRRASRGNIRTGHDFEVSGDIIHPAFGLFTAFVAFYQRLASWTRVAASSWPAEAQSIIDDHTWSGKDGYIR